MKFFFLILLMVYSVFADKFVTVIKKGEEYQAVFEDVSVETWIAKGRFRFKIIIFAWFFDE